ncbi:MAG: Nif3-like dinuclear metal center hexameric protein [Buchnera aphidicola (Periphyllus aceris)]|nr:Nif3-like dinuclear metal center hexameric protein [Buchnera aphidicola (Periphyllus aceris)]
MKNKFLEKIINKKLNSSKFLDSTYNGLQIEGCSEVRKIAIGVTACQSLLDQAIKNNFDSIIVHHGYFWDNDSKNIYGFYRKRLKKILLNNINLYSWHLPLDAHNKLSNNFYIKKVLNIKKEGILNPYLWRGHFKILTNGIELYQKIYSIFKRKPIYITNNKNKKIFSVAWCSGKGQKFIHQVIKNNIDCFITGEVSEETTHYARESGIHFFSAGHHATEIGGVKLLGKWLSSKYKDLEIKFFNIHNPI